MITERTMIWTIGSALFGYFMLSWNLLALIIYLCILGFALGQATEKKASKRGKQR